MIKHLLHTAHIELPMQKFRWLLLVLFFFNTGCSFQSGYSESRSEPSLSPLPLSDEIAETSGLTCLSDGSFLTINDSGHHATIYRLNKVGQITDRFASEAQNMDWEALALHQGKLWIADIGNNSGKRSTLQIYSTPIPTYQTKDLTHTKFQLRYTQETSSSTAPYQHALDAEALVSNGNQLLIFSKNWTGTQSEVYTFSVNSDNSDLIKVGETTTLPGLITDAAYSAFHQVYVIVGYQNFRRNPFSLIFQGDFSPFLAVLDSQYRLVGSVPIATGGQVEAICIDQTQDIWLSQEKSSHHHAQFWRWGTLTTLLNSID